MATVKERLTHRPHPPADRPRVYLLAADPRRLGILLAGVVVLIGALASAYYAGADSLRLFDLDREGYPPAAYSAFLLLAAGYITLLLRQPDPLASRRYAVLGGFYLYMGLDEGLTIHEHLSSLTGVDWPVLYLPVVAAAAVVWGMVLRRLWANVAARMLMIAGAAFWVVAQVFELVAWDGDAHTAHYSVYVVIEETFEDFGSLCFGLASLVALQWLTRRARTSAF